jgi:LmbE family N-acetylglucosaminyl deacetylase
MGIRRELTRLIRQEKPDRVVCQDPTTVFAREWYINHPDHRAAGESAIYAVFPSAETRPIFMDLLAEGLEPHKVTDLYMTLTMNPTHAVDISDTFEHKLEALLCHKSQLGDGADARKWVAEWNAEAGEKMGWKYAETFRVMTFVRPEPNGDKQDETGR